jgi:hypothetical protein
LPIALLLILAAQQVEPPRGVNDEILGTAEQFSTRGPARICLLRTSIDVEAGETAYLEYLGIHWGGISVTGPRGAFLVMEGDAWARPRATGRVTWDWRDRAIAQHFRHGRPRYLMYARADDAGGEQSPVAWVEGDALGRSRDGAILRRIDVSRRDMSSCRRRFVYGWDSMIGTGE